MRKPISTKTHAFLDYITVTTLLVVPRMMRFSKTVTNAMTAAGLVKLTYTLLTKHEGGVIKALPMKAHLAMDAVAGASLCALPFASDDADDTERLVCCAMGGFDVVASVLTETESAPTSRASIRQQIAPMSADDYRANSRAARDARESIEPWSGGGPQPTAVGR